MSERRYIGIDLGTSAVKLLLVDGKGHIEGSVTKTYPVHFPRPGWTEQAPEDWWEAVVSGIRELMKGRDPSTVAGIGTAGQMHGLVILDEKDEVIREAILWNDGRTQAETDWLNDTIGQEKLSGLTANIAFAGFTAPKLLWLAKNEPENFARIRKIMLPKDYINYRLTGVHSCDFSDASGMLLLDVKNRCWSEEMIDLCGISGEQLPRLYESGKVTGTLTAEAAKALGLPEEVKVVAGAGDNAAAAIGTGTLGEGMVNISLGTSGTVFISSESFAVDPHNALHAFCHADGYWHLMGVVLSAAACNQWFCGDILKTDDYAGEQEAILPERLGCNPVLFLPYLMGERSPVNDTRARGVFAGLSLDTSRADMVQAVFEGVGFAIRDSLEVAKSLHIPIDGSFLCGGGARSPLWRKILANILNIPLYLPKTEEGPGYGAAMLAMTGCGEYESLKDCAAALTGAVGREDPDPALAQRYEKQYAKYKELYPALKHVFPKLNS